MLSKAEYDLAIADCNEGLRLDPEYAKGYVSRSAAYDDKGDAERALADVNHAIRAQCRPMDAVASTAKLIVCGHALHRLQC
jgi:hypothetical protein